MNLNDYKQYRYVASECAKAYKRGNNCRIVRNKEEELLKDILVYQTTNKLKKAHKYVCAYKRVNYGTNNYPDLACKVIVCELKNELKTNKGSYRSAYGYIRPDDIIGFF